jgi:hypothetical protein
MNDPLQAALAEIVKRTLTGVDASVSFLSDQLPEVIQQVLMWQIVSKGILTLVFIGLTVLFFLGARYGAQEYQKIPSDGGCFAIYLISFCGIPIVSIFGMFCFMSMLKALIAPKLFLIEYITQQLAR